MVFHIPTGSQEFEWVNRQEWLLLLDGCSIQVLELERVGPIEAACSKINFGVSLKWYIWMWGPHQMAYCTSNPPTSGSIYPARVNSKTAHLIAPLIGANILFHIAFLAFCCCCWSNFTHPLPSTFLVNSLVVGLKAWQSQKPLEVSERVSRNVV